MRKRTGTRPQEEGGAKRPRTENLSLDDLQSWVDGVLNEGRTPQLVEYLPKLSKASVVALNKKLGLGVSGGNREELVRGMQQRLKMGGPPPTLSILKQPSVTLTTVPLGSTPCSVLLLRFTCAPRFNCSFAALGCFSDLASVVVSHTV
jgi:hypothetical protein